MATLVEAAPTMDCKTQTAVVKTDINGLPSADKAFAIKDFASARKLYSKALRDIGESMAADQRAELLQKRAACYRELNKLDDALPDAFKATHLNPMSIQGHILLGTIYTKLNRYEDALQSYRNGLSIDPNNKLIAEHLKEMRQLIMKSREENNNAPEKDYSALKLCSQDPYPGDNELLALEKEIVEKKYLTDMSTDVEFRPVDTEMAKKEAQIGFQQRAAGNMEAALEHYTKSVERDPVNFTAWHQRAELLYSLGRLGEALKSCDMVMLQSRPAEVWKLGGRILRHLELPVSAEKWLRKAYQMSKETDEDTALLFQQVRVSRLYDPLAAQWPIKVNFTQHGRAVFATRDGSPGDILLGDEPSVWSQTLDTIHIPACFQCTKNLASPEVYFGEEVLKTNEFLKQCVANYWPKIDIVYCDHCKYEKYCSKACKDIAWEDNHKILCPALNPASKELYDVCLDFIKSTAVNKALVGLWNASFSPFTLARMWASISCAALRLAKEAGRDKPTSSDWAMAKMPYRRFIAYGYNNDVSTIMSKMFDIMKAIFRDRGDGLGYDITVQEFNGRYYQAACNAQAYSYSNPPLKQFLTNTKSHPWFCQITSLVPADPPEAVFAGMFPLHACMNHSCDNNAEVMDGEVNGRAGVKVRAKKAIKSGEEVCITYIDTKMPREKRRAWLYRAYNFWCNCTRCKFEGDKSSECTHCGAKVSEEKKAWPACGQCKRAWYCSTKCQKQSWKSGHKKICKTKHSDNYSPSDAYTSQTSPI